MNCEFCKAPMTAIEQDITAEHGEEPIVIENAPVWLCEQCDNMVMEDDVIEAIEDMLAHLDTVSSEGE